MAVQKYTLTRVLARLKGLDARIKREIQQTCFIGVSKGTTNPTMVWPNDAVNDPGVFKNNLTAAEQSISQLIRNRDSLRSALTLSNATTKVTIGGKERTVAEVIEYKRSFIPIKREYLQHLQRQFFAAHKRVVEMNTELEDRIERQSQELARGGSSKTSVAEEIHTVMVEVRNTLTASTGPNLVDPLELGKYIAALSAELDAFETEVDFTLSESNAKTEIEVDLAG